MRKIVSAAEMREIDRLTTERFATPSVLLMEAAANSVARAIAERLPQDADGKSALILCGRGNNGGDGAALARALWMTGWRVDVVLFGRADETKGDARINFDIVRRLARSASASHTSPLSFVECDSITDWENLAGTWHGHDIIVDALFGTGLTRPLEGVFREVVGYVAQVRERREQRCQARPLFVSLDLPSGLDADSAELIGPAVHADLTVTFTAPKAANVLSPAAHLGGELIIADIGSPRELLDYSASQLFLAEADDARAWLAQTRYTPTSYKNTHGHALFIAGSRNMTGAAVLSAGAAMRAGAGLVTVATPHSALPTVTARVMPEVMAAGLAENEHGAVTDEAFERIVELSGRANVVAVGPGLTSADARTRRLVRLMVEQRTTPVVIDADGLNSLAPWPAQLHGSPERPLILTPHEGEMRRLLGAGAGDAISNRVQAAREFATTYGLILVLKGARTLVAAPDGRVVANPTGNAGLGTAGSGDTLTGIITAFNAQAFAALQEKADAFAATVAAVYVGGLAGDIAARELGMRAMVASDVSKHLSAAVRALDLKGETP